MALWIGLVGAVGALASCTPGEPEMPRGGTAPAPAAEGLDIVAGQVVYVPIFSHVYFFGDGSKRFDVTAILSVRNTDRAHPVVVLAADYYDSGGKLLHRYLPRPARLGPLAATEFVVAEKDTRGELGASFLVDWAVEQQIIEAVMIGATGARDISFVSPGRIISRRALRVPERGPARPGPGSAPGLGAGPGADDAVMERDVSSRRRAPRDPHLGGIRAAFGQELAGGPQVALADLGNGMIGCDMGSFTVGL